MTVLSTWLPEMLRESKVRRGFVIKPGSRSGWGFAGGMGAGAGAGLVFGGSGVLGQLSLLRSCTCTRIKLRPDPGTGPSVYARPRDTNVIIRRIVAGEELELHSSICRKNFTDPNPRYFLIEVEGDDQLETAELGIA